MDSCCHQIRRGLPTTGATLFTFRPRGRGQCQQKDFSEDSATFPVVVNKPTPGKPFEPRMVPTTAPLRAIEVEQVLDSICAITDAWRDGITQTMRLARIVAQARRRLRHGEWSSLWKSEGMPFSKRKGEMLAVIGDRLAWVNAQSFAHLPTGWSVLYYLARLPRGRFESLLEEGAIHPKLTQKEAKGFLGKSSRDKKSTRRLNIQRWLDRAGEFIERSRFDCGTAERKLLNAGLLRLVQRLDCAESDTSKNHSKTSLHPQTLSTTDRE